jgi:hypothetical protein
MNSQNCSRVTTPSPGAAPSGVVIVRRCAGAWGQGTRQRRGAAAGGAGAAGGPGEGGRCLGAVRRDRAAASPVRGAGVAVAVAVAQTAANRQPRPCSRGGPPSAPGRGLARRACTSAAFSTLPTPAASPTRLGAGWVVPVRCRSEAAGEPDALGACDAPRAPGRGGCARTAGAWLGSSSCAGGAGGGAGSCASSASSGASSACESHTPCRAAAPPRHAFGRRVGSRRGASGRAL